jgi:2'-5' RNA ligase
VDIRMTDFTTPQSWADVLGYSPEAAELAASVASDGWGCIEDRPTPLTAAGVPGPEQVDTTTGEPHEGAMIALIPADPAAWTLLSADPNAPTEPEDALHVTLAYLGDVAEMPDGFGEHLRDVLDAQFSSHPPLEANVFGASVWNTTGDTPSLNLAVGGDVLDDAHDEAWATIARARDTFPDGPLEAEWGPPENHAPWVPHICLMYGDHEYGLEPFYGAVGAATQMEGPIVFDRVRLALGGESWDIPLAGTVPADAPDGSMSSTSAIVAPDPEDRSMPTAAAPPRPAPTPPTDDAPCPEGQELVDGECVPVEADPAATVRPVPEPGEHAWAAMHTQGTATGDGDTGRKFTNTSYRVPPFAFHWSKASGAHGGQPVVVHVGNVVRVVPGGEGQPDYGFVKLDLESEDGREYARRLVQGHEHWVSIGLDETKPTVTAEWPAPDDDEEGDPLGMLFEEPDLVVVDGGRVGELTAVSVPAQADAEIEPTDELIRLMLGTDTDEEPEEAPVTAAARTTPRPEAPAVSIADTVQALTAAAYTITIPDLPPSWWFQEPKDVDLSEGAFNLTEDGRVYGAVAPLGVNHRAYATAGRRQEAPTARVDYSRFMGAWALTAQGKVPAGPVTMDCGHADRFRADGEVAPAHYENACTVVAKIAVGQSRDRGVVWAAGALEPGVTVDQVSRMLACRLSGDWQPHSDKAGWTDFVAALLVPSPGFPMAHGASATWEGDALVASSVPVRAVGAAGRPRLRVNLTAGKVERVSAATPAEQHRAIVAAVRSGQPVTRSKRKGCC